MAQVALFAHVERINWLVPMRAHYLDRLLLYLQTFLIQLFSARWLISLRCGGGLGWLNLQLALSIQIGRNILQPLVSFLWLQLLVRIHARGNVPSGIPPPRPRPLLLTTQPIGDVAQCDILQ